MTSASGVKSRVLSAIIIPVLKLATAVTSRPRVRVLVVNELGEVLLLRGVVSHGDWSLPGGGVNRGEPLVEAAWRELYEETGIKVTPDELVYVRTLSRTELPISFDAPLFRARVKRANLPTESFNPREILEVRWFDPRGLPAPLSPIARTATKELFDRGN